MYIRFKDETELYVDSAALNRIVLPISEEQTYESIVETITKEGNLDEVAFIYEHGDKDAIITFYNMILLEPIAKIEVVKDQNCVVFGLTERKGDYDDRLKAVEDKQAQMSNFLSDVVGGAWDEE